MFLRVVRCMCLMLVVMSLAAVVSLRQAYATSTFARLGNLLPQTTELTVLGSQPTSYRISLPRRGGFGDFVFHASNLYYPGGGAYQLMKLRVDFNGDGIYDWDTSSNTTRNWTYPQPVRWADKYSVGVEASFLSNTGQGDIKNWTIPFVVARRAPRVYRNSHGDDLTQLVDEECPLKAPVLIVEGFDPLNQTFAENVEYQFQNQGLIDSLYARDCEVFTLNFSENQRDMKLNADVVMEALETIRQLCPNKEAAVIGFSMGGVITRFALARAEGNGVPHHVGVFISLDSPHAGANISPDVQDQLRGIQSSNEVVADLHQLMSAMATKQLLLFNAYDPEGTEFFNFRDARDALNGDGMPHQCYNAAISNGNRYHTHGNGWLTEGRHLADFSILFHNEGLPVIHCVAFDTDLGAGSTTSNYADVWTVPWRFGIDFQATMQFDPVFIPTSSAVGVPFEQMHTSNYNAVGDILVMPSTPFDGVVYQGTSQIHAAVTEDTKVAILGAMARSSNVVVSYSTPEGGAINAETFPVSILSGGSVLVSPKTVVVNGQQMTYVFGYWDDGTTDNPRTFFGTHNITRTAVLKLHQASAVSGVTWSGTQRRIVEHAVSGGAIYHAAYESGGAIWYLRKPTGGEWENERCLSVPAAGATSASIYNSGSYVKVAWLEPDGNIHFRTTSDDGGTWSAIGIVATHGAATPLMSDAGIVWTETGSYPGIWVSQSGYSPTRLSGLPTNAVLPAVCESSDNVKYAPTGCRPGGWVAMYGLAFVSGGKVKVTDFYRENGALTYCSLGTDVSASGSGVAATNPTIVSQDTVLYVAWEETGLNLHRIGFRQRNKIGGWRAPVYFAALQDGATKPVLSIDNSVCASLNLFWQYSGGIARVTRSLSNPAWSAVVNVGSGVAPSSGGVHAYKLTTMVTTGTAAPFPLAFNNTFGCSAGGGGGGDGCPFVDTETDTGWVVENSVLARSLGGPPPLDVYKLTGVPAVDNGRVALRVRENEDEVSEIDRMRLVAVDHPIGTDVARVDGEYVVGTWHSPYQIMGPTGDDLTEQLGTPYGHFQGEPGDTLLVWMQDPNGSEVAEVGNAMVIGPGGKGGASTLAARGDNGPLSSAAIDAGLLRFTGIEVQQQDSSGVWETVRHIYPREFFAQTAIDTLLSDPIRLVFVGHHALRGLGWLEPSGDSAVVQELPLLTAVHSSLGDVQTALLGSDASMFFEDHASTVELVNGDTLNVEFGATAPDDAVAREYVLLAEGTYTTATGEVVPLHRSLAPPEASLRFALAQNRPNPFGMGTTIGFDLPRSSHVRLEIFDLQGRRVQTIADKDYAPGHWNAAWNRRDLNGAIVPGGVYLYRLSAGAFRSQRKMVLLP